MTNAARRLTVMTLDDPGARRAESPRWEDDVQRQGIEDPQRSADRNLSERRPAESNDAYVRGSLSERLRACRFQDEEVKELDQEREKRRGREIVDVAQCKPGDHTENDAVKRRWRQDARGSRGRGAYPSVQ
jgi:hypothetical protein